MRLYQTAAQPAAVDERKVNSLTAEAGLLHVGAGTPALLGLWCGPQESYLGLLMTASTH